MKKNRIHSLLKSPKKCLLCNKKKIFTFKNFIGEKEGFICLNCKENNRRFIYYYKFNFEFIVLYIKYDLNNEYYIKLYTNQYKTFSITIERIDNFFNEKNKIFILNDLSYIDFRKIQLESLIKIIETYRDNLIFL